MAEPSMKSDNPLVRKLNPSNSPITTVVLASQPIRINTPSKVRTDAQTPTSVNDDVYSLNTQMSVIIRISHTFRDFFRLQWPLQY